MRTLLTRSHKFELKLLNCDVIDHITHIELLLAVNNKINFIIFFFSLPYSKCGEQNGFVWGFKSVAGTFFTTSLPIKTTFKTNFKPKKSTFIRVRFFTFRKCFFCIQLRSNSWVLKIRRNACKLWTAIIANGEGGRGIYFNWDCKN